MLSAHDGLAAFRTDVETVVFRAAADLCDLFLSQFRELPAHGFHFLFQGVQFFFRISLYLLLLFRHLYIRCSEGEWLLLFCSARRI